MKSLACPAPSHISRGRQKPLWPMTLIGWFPSTGSIQIVHSSVLLRDLGLPSLLCWDRPVSQKLISWDNTTIRKCHLRARVHKIAKRQAEGREAVDVQSTGSDQHTAQPLQKKRQNQCIASREYVGLGHRSPPALYVTTCHSPILQPVPPSLPGSP